MMAEFVDSLLSLELCAVFYTELISVANLEVFSCLKDKRAVSFFDLAELILVTLPKSVFTF